MGIPYNIYPSITTTNNLIHFPKWFKKSTLEPSLLDSTRIMLISPPVMALTPEEISRPFIKFWNSSSLERGREEVNSKNDYDSSLMSNISFSSMDFWQTTEDPSLLEPEEDILRVKENEWENTQNKGQKHRCVPNEDDDKKHNKKMEKTMQRTERHKL